jgi:hypothetical protein
MRVRPLNKESHLPVIKSYWISRFKSDLPEEVMSEKGLVVEAPDGRVIASVFLYFTLYSNICFMGWPIADPVTEKEERSKALDLLFTEAPKYVKNMGYARIWTMSSVTAVDERLKKTGYLLGDQNVNQYWFNM